jgi:inosine/xanthosine triphosphatase
MKIVICTLNKAKNNAVKNVIDHIWTGIDYVSISSESGVSDQPLSDNEGIQGAINRAKFGLESVTDAEYSIGLEGTVDETEYGMFLNGWAAVMHKSGEVGLGCSGKVELPYYIAEELKQGKELGPLIQEMMNDDSIRNTIGTNGVLTKGLYGRTKEFQDAVSCALSRFLRPDLYKKIIK